MQEISKKEDELLEAKIFDKYRFCNEKNKIVYTDFLDMHNIGIAEKLIKKEALKKYIFFGGSEDYKNNDRCVLIFYPEKLTEEMCKANYKNILEVVKITLPNELKGTFENCTSLDKVNLTHFDSSKVATMDHMFYNCKSLTSLDFSEFNLENLVNSSFMFCGCIKITEIKFNNNSLTKI